MAKKKSKDMVKEMEKYILQLPEIISCKMILDDKDEIVEIHVLSGNTRSPKQITRDIQSLLIAKWAVEIDHKIISVAQISKDVNELPTGRMSISRVDYSIEEIHAHVQVSLKYQDKLYVGEEMGLHTSNGALRLIANATLKAVEKYLGTGHCFSIEDIERTSLAKKNIIIVAVALLTPYEEKSFVGSSLVYHDENHSVVRATLDALNRLIDRK